MGRHHARAIERTAGVCVSVVVDRHLDRARQIADLTGGHATDRLEDALGCDAAVVATPSDEHTDPALAFLNAGRPVLVEKPLAERLDDVQRLVEASARRDVPLMCGFVERFNPAVRAAVALLSGAPVHMASRRSSPPVPRVRTGVVHDLLIHDIDLAIHFTGGVLVEDVVARPGDLPNGGRGDEAGCAIAFADGATAFLWASRMSDPERKFVIDTPDQRFELDLARPALIVSGRPRDLPGTGPGADPLASQLQHFLTLLQGRVDGGPERARLAPPHVAAARLLAACPVTPCGT
jgi:predicted dehydrogenase